MTPRKRERIQRKDEIVQTCEACGASMLDTWSRRVTVNGFYLNLCTTCQSEARSGDKALKAYLRARAEYGDDVNEKVLYGL
jgi:hypothetical protein